MESTERFQGVCWNIKGLGSSVWDTKSWGNLLEGLL